MVRAAKRIFKIPGLYAAYIVIAGLGSIGIGIQELLMKPVALDTYGDLGALFGNLITALGYPACLLSLWVAEKIGRLVNMFFHYVSAALFGIAAIMSWELAGEVFLILSLVMAAIGYSVQRWKLIAVDEAN